MMSVMRWAVAPILSLNTQPLWTIKLRAFWRILVELSSHCLMASILNNDMSNRSLSIYLLAYLLVLYDRSLFRVFPSIPTFYLSSPTSKKRWRLSLISGPRVSSSPAIFKHGLFLLILEDNYNSVVLSCSSALRMFINSRERIMIVVTPIPTSKLLYRCGYFVSKTAALI